MRRQTTEYRQLHYWVEEQLGKPSKCEKCETTVAVRFEWANKSGKYLRDITDWIRLCPPCHRRMDKRRDYWRDEFCKHGHRLTLDNIYLKKNKVLPTGWVECRTCREESRVKWRRKIGKLYKRELLKAPTGGKKNG